MDNKITNLLPNDPFWTHATGPGTDGVELHYVRVGHGPKVLLLHGWPGFWYDWRKVIPMLSGDADVIAPDFRGFGDSSKPKLPPEEYYTSEVFARDIVKLLDSLHIDQVTVAGHDIGTAVAQALSRMFPERIKAMVLINPAYPGVGNRRFDLSRHKEIWYQHFHNLSLAEKLIGYNRDTVRIYLSHFYDHWVGRKESISKEEFEAIVDKYAQPGAILGSISYYRSLVPALYKEAASTSKPEIPPITVPTTVLWGEKDPVIPSSWSDRLNEYFSQVTLRLLPGIGHFVPFEAPEEVCASIRDALKM
jgi:pimeloyl-ACP methyl ester carboxylesterase